MQGFDAFSEFPISAIYTPTTAATVGTAIGAAIVAGHARKLGVYGAAGTAIGMSFASGATFKLGNANQTRNQPFDFSVNALQALLWRFNKGASLTAIIQAKQAWYNQFQTQFWENWYTDVFNLPTANDFGCSVWSVILGLPLAIEYDTSDGENWGFGPYQKNFNHGNFAPEIQTVLPLTVEQKRLVLLLRYFQLITHGDITSINRMLSRLFKNYGPAYVFNGRNMTMTYVFLFNLPAPLSFILKYYNLLPSPTGVQTSFISNGQSVGTAKGEAFANGVT